MKSMVTKHILFFLSAVLYAVSSYYTAPKFNLFEMCVATVLLLYYINTVRFTSFFKLPTMLFFYGALFHAVAFYWLSDTLIAFGHFSKVTSAIGFIVFCAISGVQFFLCGVLYQLLEKVKFCKVALISFPIAWCITEYFYPRLFPWYLMNLHLSWSSFATFAEYLSLPVLAGIFLWWVNVIMYGRRKGVIFAVAGSFLFCIFCGNIKNQFLLKELAEADTIKIALIQANSDSIVKRDPKVMEHYKRLTEELLDEDSTKGKPDIIIWPESAVNFWILADTTDIKKTLISSIGFYGVPLLFGGMTMEYVSIENSPMKDIRKYNTIVGVNDDGMVAGMYHKRTLVPLGEYLPLGNTLPFLRKYSPESGNFEKGTLNKPIPLTVATHNRTINFGILICYEDLMPKLAREMTRDGADILVSFSNDIWLRSRNALAQHTFLSMWRAVENKRYLLRATNTGWTTVINPLGQIVAELPLYETEADVFGVQIP